MAKAAVCSKAVVLLLLIQCLMSLSLLCGRAVFDSCFYAFLSVLTSCTIMLTRNRELVALL